ncbi:hypothetical protein DH2020_045808 [Rehmannia glutinosa]|uniref:Uncharacterized protein n=1 Tax=Rehmannia glutinosa TaxID=99300 RepID=A0ABR0UDU0_REHGL
MDLLPGESPQILSKHKQRFRSLKLVNVNDDAVLSETPYGVDYGRLSNGLTYYESECLLSAISVLEEEEERGVAHIVEHLAFSATKKYTNHDIVKFLESIGAEFGACQNAVTSADETVYELFVPVDKPELLSQSISVLAEFSSEVRVSADDLEKERGAVLEEYRGSRNANGRMQDAHWVLMMEGSKYAERLPIGLEKVIRTVTPEIVKRFYNKWYHMQNMALIAVGDFPDTQSVVELIKTHFEDKVPALDPPFIPQFTVPSHEEPRFQASWNLKQLGCKVPVVELKTVKDYRNLLAESMFFHALNQRFFKLSRKNNPPYFSCSAAADHFLRNEPVVGIEYEAQLHKTLLPYITATEVSKYSENFRTSFSCVIKTIEPHAAATVDDLRTVVLKVNSFKKKETFRRGMMKTFRKTFHVVQQHEYSSIGATELMLSNGMRVCYKCTDFFDDQVLFTGFSYGGLSELQEYEYFSCSMGPTIAGEIGVFGQRPSVLTDMLAGKRAEVGTSLGAYMRSFSGDCSPSDLETALQLVYQLFVTNLEPGEDDVKIVMQMAEESVRAQERDPYTAFANRPIKIGEIRKVDPFRACEYFNNCFKDPSTFTVVIVGNIDPATACPLILQYLGGIPRPPKPILNFKRDELKGLPFTFPSTVIRSCLSPMVQAQCSVQLCFPVELKNENMMEDVHLTGLMSKLLETKILQVLRFKHGQIYSAGVSVFLGGNKPSRVGNIRGDISVNFSCDPEISATLVNLALDEILHLQEEGPTDADVSAILEIEQRAYENGLQENYHWLERILRSYQSRIYSGDVGASFKIQDEGRTRVRNSLTPVTAQSALQRIIPFPCKKQYTVVILMPQSSHLKKLKSFISSRDAKILVGVAGSAVLALSLWRYSRRAKTPSVNGLSTDNNYAEQWRNIGFLAEKVLIALNVRCRLAVITDPDGFESLILVEKMATLNPLGLLGDDDVEYPSLLLAAQQKAAAPASAPGQPKKAPAQAQPAAKASAKLPSKPLPPSHRGRPVIILLQMCRAKKYKGEIRVSNTYYVTKMSLNWDVEETVDFRSSFCSSEDEVSTPLKKCKKSGISVEIGP